MLDDRPILKDRLMALGTFSGIAIAAVAGFEMVIGGGMDFVMPGQEIRAVAPSSYVRVVDQPWSAEPTRLVPLSSNEYMFAGEEAPYPAERLAGAADDADAPRGGYPAQNEDELYANIEALYAQDADYAVEEVAYESEPIADDEPYVLYVDEKKADEATY
jgi:hypothetical protein